MDNDINTLVEIALLFEVVNPNKRFRTKMLRKTRRSQQNVFAGQTASRMSKKMNPSLAARKAYYRKMYQQMKQREQKLYKARAQQAARRR